MKSPKSPPILEIISNPVISTSVVYEVMNGFSMYIFTLKQILFNEYISWKPIRTKLRIQKLTPSPPQKKMVLAFIYTQVISEFYLDLVLSKPTNNWIYQIWFYVNRPIVGFIPSYILDLVLTLSWNQGL